MRHAIAALCCVLPAVAQENAVLLVPPSVGSVQVRGEAASEVVAPAAVALPAGTWRLQFAVGSKGRPAPLSIEAPPRGTVAVATAGGARIGGSVLAATVGGTQTFARGREDGGDRAMRVQVRLRQKAGSGPAGVAVRWRDADNHYRFVRDPARRELRLERRFLGRDDVLARVAAVADDGWHTIELEIAGFGISAWLDGEPVVRTFDGGLDSGGLGTFAADAATVEFADLIAAAPAAPVASLAVASGDGEAAIVANVPAAAGGGYVLALRPDRPLVAWPTDSLGFEPPLLVRLAEPVFLVGFGCGDIGDDGAIAAELRWPRLPALRLQAALVGGWLGSPDGSELRARLPWATIVF